MTSTKSNQGEWLSLRPTPGFPTSRGEEKRGKDILRGKAWTIVWTCGRGVDIRLQGDEVADNKQERCTIGRPENLGKSMRRKKRWSGEMFKRRRPDARLPPASSKGGSGPSRASELSCVEEQGEATGEGYFARAVWRGTEVSWTRIFNGCGIAVGPPERERRTEGKNGNATYVY